MKGIKMSIAQALREEDIKLEMKGLKNIGIEITGESLKKYADSQCNLTTCRYNQSGTCTNEDKRKECAEVSKRVLCLEDRENE